MEERSATALTSRLAVVGSPIFMRLQMLCRRWSTMSQLAAMAARQDMHRRHRHRPFVHREMGDPEGSLLCML